MHRFAMALSLSIGLALVPAATATTGTVAGTAALPPLSLRFVENRGQHGGHAAYAARVGSATVLFEPGAMVVRLPATRPIQGPCVAIAGAPDRAAAVQPEVEVAFAFEGANPAARIVARDELPGRHSCYIGRDPTRWHTGLKAYAALEYQDLWPGISVVVRERDGRLHYDVIVEPGADPAAFALRAGGTGVCGVRIDETGALVTDTVRGPILQTVPAAWEEVAASGGASTPVAARFIVCDGGRITLHVAGRDAARRLVIDPGFDFTPIFAEVGGVLDVQFFSVEVDPVTGAQVVAGYVGPDAVVYSYDVLTGVFFFETIIAGVTGFDLAVDLAFDAAGDLYVSGVTDSIDLPTTPGSFMPVAPGLGDAFVAHLGPGGVLLDLTYVGGTFGTEASNATIDIGPDGLIAVAGYTESADFPVGPAGLVFDPTYNGLGDVWVMLLDPTLAFSLSSTFLGGPALDSPGMGGIEVGPDLAISVGGWTESPGFPVLLATDPFYGGLTDGFLTRFAPGLVAGLLFSTYRGGPLFDAFNGIGVDDEGNLWGAGYTESPGMPFMGPAAVLDITYNGAGDAWLVKHSPAGFFIWGLYRGGSGTDSAMRVAVDRFGRSHITGTTNSGYLPSLVPFPITPIDGIGPVAGGFDAYIALIGPDGDIESYSSYLDLASPADESCSGIALATDGDAFVSGIIGGPLAAPTTAPIAHCVFPWMDEGFALAGATEPQLMGDGTLVGGLPLELRLSNVAPFSPVFLFIGLAPLYAPAVGGVLVPVPTMMLLVAAGPAGEMVLPAIWPVGIPADVMLWMQAWLPDALAPLGYAASNGIALLTP